MNADASPRGYGAGRALVMLIPAFVLAWSWPSVLADDLAPETSAAGLAALFAIPAAAWTVLRPPRQRPRALALLLGALGLGAGWLAVGATLDSLDGDRAYLTGLLAVTLLVAGAGLDAHGRRALVRAATVLGALLVLGAWFDPSRAGALGNTGDLAEAALPCALCGASLALVAHKEHIAWRVVGGLVALGFAAWCIVTPSLTGALALAGALSVATLGTLLRNDTATGRGRSGALLAGAAALVLGGLFVAKGPALATLGSDVVVAANDELGANAHGDVGGFEVRQRIGASTVALTRDHLWTGVGPGQFARAFPPYRDPLEIELSTLARQLPGETEVEHPHNDWLVGFAELGVLGGSLLAAFLIAVLAAAWRALKSTEPARFALGAAAVAILIDALAHAPLSDNPAAACVAFGVFGTLLARNDAPAPQPSSQLRALATRLVPTAVLALLVSASPDARAMAAHGRALGELSRTQRRDADDPEIARAKRGLKHIDAALRARPDSALAHTLRARLLAPAGAGISEQIDAWSAVLQQRPHRFEALMQIGTLHARSGDAAEARAYFDHALLIDPVHPGLLENRVRLEFLEGRIPQGVETLARWSERAPPEDTWFERFGAELLLRGLDREASVLLAYIDEHPTEQDGHLLWQRAKELREQGRDPLADAYEAHAHRLWAREHAEAGRFHDAVRSYRQCLAKTLVATPSGSLRVRMELAAAALSEGDREEARLRLGDDKPSAADWAGMPPWAGEALIASGWFGS